MEVKAYFSESPQPILYEKHDDANWVWLRKNIHEEAVVQDEQEFVQFVCDEVFFKTGATAEEIEADFNAYYEFGKNWEEEKAPTIEERLSAVEDVILELMG